MQEVYAEGNKTGTIVQLQRDFCALPDRIIVYALIWQRKRPVRAGVQQALYFDGQQSPSEPRKSAPHFIFLIKNTMKTGSNKNILQLDLYSVNSCKLVCISLILVKLLLFLNILRTGSYFVVDNHYLLSLKFHLLSPVHKAQEQLFTVSQQVPKI